MASDLQRLINDLGLPSYLQTALAQHGLKTVRDLVKLSEDDLRGMHGLGGMSIRRIKLALYDLGLKLGQCSGRDYRPRRISKTKESAHAPSRQPRQTVRRRPAP